MKVKSDLLIGVVISIFIGIAASFNIMSMAILLILPLLGIYFLIKNRKYPTRWLASIFIYLLFQPAILVYVTGVAYKIINYSDDIIGVVLFFIFVYNFFKGKFKIKIFEFQILICITIFFIIGIISGVHFQYQTLSLAFVDGFICSKFLFYYFGCRAISENRIPKDFLYTQFNALCRIVAIVFFLLTVHDLIFVPFFTTGEFRYFTESIKLFYGHPTSLARACSIVIFILAANMEYNKNNLRYIYLLIFVMTFTFRSKALASCAVILMIYYAVIKFKLKSKIILLLSATCIALTFGANQLIAYYTHPTYTRALLTSDAIKLANQNFPFGTGFGSFGSNIAATYYSDLYVELGYSKIWGMGADSSFLSDTFWPTVIAQTGWIGTMVFLVIIFILIKFTFRQIREYPYYFWSLISVLIYDLISSLGEPAFFHPSDMTTYLIVGIIVSQLNEKKREKIKKELL